jgi:hypothetical protein
MTILEEWKSYSRYTKTVLSIYALVSLPLMPLYIILIPFAWWVTTSEGTQYKRLPLADFLSFAMSMSIFAYMIAAIVRCSQ